MLQHLVFATTKRSFATTQPLNPTPSNVGYVPAQPARVRSQWPSKEDHNVCKPTKQRNEAATTGERKTERRNAKSCARRRALHKGQPLNKSLRPTRATTKRSKRNLLQNEICVATAVASGRFVVLITVDCLSVRWWCGGARVRLRGTPTTDKQLDLQLRRRCGCGGFSVRPFFDRRRIDGLWVAPSILVVNELRWVLVGYWLLVVVGFGSVVGRSNTGSKTASANAFPPNSTTTTSRSFVRPFAPRTTTLSLEASA